MASGGRSPTKANAGGPLGEPAPMVLAQNVVYHQAEHASHIVLPVVRT
jgi:hypothetical protein